MTVSIKCEMLLTVVTVSINCEMLLTVVTVSIKCEMLLSVVSFNCEMLVLWQFQSAVTSYCVMINQLWHVTIVTVPFSCRYDIVTVALSCDRTLMLPVQWNPSRTTTLIYDHPFFTTVFSLTECLRCINVPSPTTTRQTRPTTMAIWILPLTNDHPIGGQHIC